MGGNIVAAVADLLIYYYSKVGMDAWSLWAGVLHATRQAELHDEQDASGQFTCGMPGVPACLQSSPTHRQWNVPQPTDTHVQQLQSGARRQRGCQWDDRQLIVVYLQAANGQGAGRVHMWAGNSQR